MKQHDFSPVLDEDSYENATKYVALQARKLVKTVLDTDLKINTVTIFTHSANEYGFLENLLRQKGEVSNYSHGATLYVEVDIDLDGQKIMLLGVRQPDTSRPEVGYADYPVTNYDEIKKKNYSNPYVNEIISGSGMNLLELRHPNFDVRGYLVNARRKEIIDKN